MRWGNGPWVNEPDFATFTHVDLPCSIVRTLEHLCGYVGVQVGHPWHQKAAPPVRVHGGCNFASFMHASGYQTDSVEEAQPKDTWWFGFELQELAIGEPK